MALQSKIKPVELVGEKVVLIDQTILPYEYKKIEITDFRDIAKAIKDMIVRGAPAIGISGAHGLALAALEYKKLEKSEFFKKLDEAAQYLISQRPTAVNLEWAVNKLLDFAKQQREFSVNEIVEKMFEYSKKLELEDIEINIAIGDNGAQIVPKGATILTHCNAGALATVGYGTALGVVRSAFEKDNTVQVFADETRPRQQGARLTTWELVEDGIPVTLIDTAGIRNDNEIDKVEQIGIEYSKQSLDEADCVLFVYDATQGIRAEDEEILNLINPEKLIKCANKTDLANVKDLDVIKISAKTCNGLEELKSALKSKVCDINPDEMDYVTNLRQQNCLNRAKEALIQALNAAEIGELQDLISIDVKSALLSLDELSGEIITDDILNNIFDNFCIGK